MMFPTRKRAFVKRRCHNVFAKTNITSTVALNCNVDCCLLNYSGWKMDFSFYNMHTYTHTHTCK